jgi:phosphatidylserine decarboxylase precursor
VDGSAASLVSPVDGIMSAAGRIDGATLLQAKGIHYTLEDLLATDLADAALFENGSFATMYLAPWNYHRVHSPLAGELTAARYVPGHLYSVNQTTVELLPRLFTRTERRQRQHAVDRQNSPAQDRRRRRPRCRCGRHSRQCGKGTADRVVQHGIDGHRTDAAR